jgi:hypothetical protein
MNFESLSDTALVARETQIGRDAAERLCQDGDRTGIIVAVGVARSLGRRHAALKPVGADGRQLNTKVTVTAT